MRKLFKRVGELWQDDKFLHHLENVEIIVAKVLSIAMVMVILAAVYDLCFFLINDFLIPELTSPEFGQFAVSLFKVFGLFLNVLIALEILENIAAYLKKHVIQVELVIVTSLIAVARKIIILDLEKKDAADLIALAIAILSLALSYWIIRRIGNKTHL
jgi:uncharacterized membrane protein (DUF373 family)